MNRTTVQDCIPGISDVLPEHPCQNMAKSPSSIYFLMHVSSFKDWLQRKENETVCSDSNMSFRTTESNVRKAGSPGKDLLKIRAFRLFHMINKVCAASTWHITKNVECKWPGCSLNQYQNYLFWDASESMSSGNKIYSY